MKKIKHEPWYNNLIVVCSGVLLYVILTNLLPIINATKSFIGYFLPVIIGCVLAYIVNPLACLIKRECFNKNRFGKQLSITFAYIIVLCFMVFSIAILIPQLIDSITTFSENLPDYASAFEEMFHNLGIKSLEKYIHNTFSSSERIVLAITNLIKNNADSVIETSTLAGKGVAQFFISFLLSIYLLIEKDNLKKGFIKLFRVITPKDKYEVRIDFLRKCNQILNTYVIYNLLDSIIIGVINAIAMAIMGLLYIGLISLVVAITNLIPTFGPLVGGAIGTLILLLINPVQAIGFIVITLIIQFFDAYILKPRLFGNSLGISGLWILISIIVGGRMFGITGILLAIPVIAILDLIYKDYLFPYLEKKFSESNS